MQQEQNNPKHDEQRLVKLSVNDLTAIGHALFPYAQFVHRIIPPSPERSCILMTIEQLRSRIASLQSAHSDDGEVPFPMTEEELRVIDAALATFLDGIHRFIPQSTQRNEITQACSKLRQYLINASYTRYIE